MYKEKIHLTDNELEDFDFTDSGEDTVWKLRGEIYRFVEEIRVDHYFDGPAYDIIVQRASDKKFFKWNCSSKGIFYVMESGDNFMEEVSPVIVQKTIYK